MIYSVLYVPDASAAFAHKFDKTVEEHKKDKK